MGISGILENLRSTLGPLLDIGRNLFTFPCAWLHRQGILTFWNRHRRPQLEGDNWWRGHAAAFLRHVNLPSEALRQGRVYQAKRECAYFVTVVHELQSVVVAIRGTETPEDLLTDGLGREFMLIDSDLIGLLQSEKIPEATKQQVISSKPHFAHEGIIEAARELALQLDGLSGDAQWSSLDTLAETSVFSEMNRGVLSTLLGPGGECERYALRFVGHSLGGSIAALTALKLLGRYPELHVYGYGVLPCVDASLADACSSFVTSIVYNDEFSSRLSVSSIKRLRITAVKALAADSSSDSGSIRRLARRFLGSQPPVSSLSDDDGLNFTEDVIISGVPNKRRASRFKFSLRGRDGDNDGEESEVLTMNDDVERQRQISAWETKAEADSKHHDPSCEEVDHICEDFGQVKLPGSSSNGGTSRTVFGTDICCEDESHCEMFMPGLIVHLVHSSKSTSSHSWNLWGKRTQQGCRHRALIKDRRAFQDLVISASMFLDHMPWRCQYALNDVLEYEEFVREGVNDPSESLV